MPYALVGSAGTVNSTGTNTANTPSYGQSPTAGNLLVLVVAGAGTSTNPAIPAGWSVGKQQAGGSVTSASIFYLIAAGADAQPTLSANISAQWSAQLYEFSGNVASSPLDQSGGATGITATITATNGAQDAAAGELMIACSCANYTTTGLNGSDSFNNGATATTAAAGMSTATNRYTFSRGITTSNAAADSNVHSQSTTNLNGDGTALASFKAAAARVPDVAIALRVT